MWGKKKKDDHEILGIRSQREKCCLQQKSWGDNLEKISMIVLVTGGFFFFFNMDDILEQTFVEM